MFCQNLYSEHAVLFGQNRPLSENSIGAITNHLQKAQSCVRVCIVIKTFLDLYLKTHLFYKKFVD